MSMNKARRLTGHVDAEVSKLSIMPGNLLLTMQGRDRGPRRAAEPTRMAFACVGSQLHARIDFEGEILNSTRRARVIRIGRRNGFVLARTAMQASGTKAASIARIQVICEYLFPVKFNLILTS